MNFSSLSESFSEKPRLASDQYGEVQPSGFWPLGTTNMGQNAAKSSQMIRYEGSS